ncbi:MmgE/PrpD family protein [Aquamicrobium terrae]|uniref:2-methylcitrate dehydratase PrpD n=1 Tax=Aquamicrobium terrae TaxID=1324945 RepID=A0ABV2N7D4_9HYPH
MALAEEVTKHVPAQLPGITRSLAEFAANASLERVPGDVIEGSKRSLLDTIGVMLGGCGEPAPRLLARYACSYGIGKASLIGQGQKVAAPLAALVNGTAADVLGFSDIVVDNMNHPSGSVCAAVLALAEERDASGADVILAHLIGVEVADKIGVGVKPQLQIKGWHPLAVLNTFGVAAACGRLLKLDTDKMANALGIAGVMASGMRAGNGTMSKAFGAGRAARDGLEAALLAKMGFTGSTAVIEARDGFLLTFGDGASGAGILDNLGDPYEFTNPGMTYKAYPTCTRSHPGINAALKLRAQYKFGLDDIDHIVCNVAPAVADYLKFGVATTKLEAKYSLPFCVALALIEGRVTLANVTDEKVGDPQVIALMKKVTMQISEDFARHGYLPPHAPHGCRVHVHLKSGLELVQQENRGPWEPTTPPTWEHLSEKYRRCAELVLSDEAIDGSIDLLSRLETVSRIHSLIDLIRQPDGVNARMRAAEEDVT